MPFFNFATGRADDHSLWPLVVLGMAFEPLLLMDRPRVLELDGTRTRTPSGRYLHVCEPEDIVMAPRNARGGCIILCSQVTWSPGLGVPEEAASLPYFEVITARGPHYTAPTCAQMDDMVQARTTCLFFRDRASHRAAFRAARQIAGGWPAADAVQGCAWVLYGERHRALVLDEGLAASAEQWPQSWFARQGCRHCGAVAHTEPCTSRERFVEWVEPDVCAACETLADVLDAVAAEPLLLTDGKERV